MELVPATRDDKPVLFALNEYYTYDFSELLELDVGEQGSFGGARLERHFEDPRCHPFLIRVDGKLAGFALHESRSRLTGDEGVNDVADFFVMRSCSIASPARGRYARCARTWALPLSGAR